MSRAPQSSGPAAPAAAYDRFAWFYHRYWGSGPDAFAYRILPVLDRLVLPHVPAGARILDLCCGDGTLADLLQARGYRVTGVDGSLELLRYARRTAPDARFICADVRRLALPPVFDAVLCTYDSVNHLMDRAELEAAFRAAAGAVRPGGRFCFDVNTADGYLARWRGSFSIIADDHVLAARPRFDPATGVATFQLALFRQEEGRWTRTDLTLSQRCHPDATLREALQAAGFAAVEVSDAERDWGLREPGRAIYLAVRA
ncbi:MAG: class I SAM-dependent methyltransferase [Armatimonadota bacterium]|nr:class I SAM-dependent methyltransferase [Armatimonadota bacterium]MDR7401345.1 class I SAM-dependent methyltransferase [Armatimonadota bacterium]MDR7404473.1 class I SAM-dependent methyltransferase [Armatimonadota bacterium]MDR7437476.1 class I SAM-dependent methyltransferase [Armatimonadota bacterium]MDR7472359.1 class I SAM-dependent methyltransferase [Armatimonadota bacterium]